jgi:hypothetical protein
MALEGLLWWINDDYTDLRPGQSIARNHGDVTGIQADSDIAGFYDFVLNDEGVPEFRFNAGEDGPVIALWRADVSSGKDPESKLIMQEDGDLCLYDRNGKFLWGSMTQGLIDAPGSSLVVNKHGYCGIKPVQWLPFSGYKAGCLIWSVCDKSPFRWGPMPAEDPAPFPTSAFLNSLSINNLLKSAVSGVVGLIPEVGGVLSKVVGTLWPDEKPKTLQWDEIREGMKTIAQGLIDEDRAKKLHADISKLLEHLKTYDQTSFDIEMKGAVFTTILSWFEDHKSDFIENATPWKNIQDFVQLGTLHLAFLHHQLHEWDRIWPRDKGKDTSVHKKSLDETCNLYVAAAKMIREKCIEWRFQQIQITAWENDGMRNLVYGQDKKRTVRDNFRDPPIIHEIRSSAADDSGRIMGETVSRKYHQNFCDHVDIVYRQQVDDILSPALLWPLFKETPGTSHTITREVTWTTDIMGSGMSRGMTHFNDKAFAEQNGAISRIELHGHDRVDGIEVWYGGVSSGLRGCKERSGHSVVLDIDTTKEAIVEFSGNVGQWVYALQVYVSEEKMIQAGSKLNFGGEDSYVENFHMGSSVFGPSPTGQGVGTLKYLYGFYRTLGGGYIERLGAVFHTTVPV